MFINTKEVNQKTKVKVSQQSVCSKFMELKTGYYPIELLKRIMGVNKMKNLKMTVRLNVESIKEKISKKQQIWW